LKIIPSQKLSSLQELILTFKKEDFYETGMQTKSLTKTLWHYECSYSYIRTISGLLRTVSHSFLGMSYAHYWRPTIL